MARSRERYHDNRKLIAYFESDRGRSFIRSTLRRSRTVEQLIDQWLLAHPEHPAMPHADDDDQRSVVQSAGAQAAASVEVTDPGSMSEDGTDSAGDDMLTTSELTAGGAAAGRGV